MKFEIGEVAILIGGYVQELIGRDCTIIGLNAKDGSDYEIEFDGVKPKDYNGSFFACNNVHLKKKNPPEEKIDWVKMCKLNQIGEIA
jgi:hypothetical protein